MFRAHKYHLNSEFANANMNDVTESADLKRMADYDYPKDWDS